MFIFKMLENSPVQASLIPKFSGVIPQTFVKKGRGAKGGGWGKK